MHPVFIMALSVLTDLISGFFTVLFSVFPSMSTIKDAFSKYNDELEDGACDLAEACGVLSIVLARCVLGVFLVGIIIESVFRWVSLIWFLKTIFTLLFLTAFLIAILFIFLFFLGLVMLGLGMQFPAMSKLNPISYLKAKWESAKLKAEAAKIKDDTKDDTDASA